MNKTQIFAATLCFLIHITSFASGKVDTAFEFFQSLKGSWVIQSEGKNHFH